MDIYSDVKIAHEENLHVPGYLGIRTNDREYVLPSTRKCVHKTVYLCEMAVNFPPYLRLFLISFFFFLKKKQHCVITLLQMACNFQDDQRKTDIVHLGYFTHYI